MLNLQFVYDFSSFKTRLSQIQSIQKSEFQSKLAFLQNVLV